MTARKRYHVFLDEDVEARALLLIYSPDYSYGFPKGALSDLVNRALREYLRPTEPIATLPKGEAE